MRKGGHLGLDEPFAALFTQGMVTHASFRSVDGRWLTPDEVELRGDGSAVERGSGGAVQVGRIEKMSKSKRNTIDPGEIIDRYGADTARWFILSDNPPDRDMEWTESGVVGAFRFTQRLFRLVEAAPVVVAEMPGQWSAAARTLRRVTHRTIGAVTDALEDFAYNVAVARIYEFTNAMSEAERGDAGDAGLAWARREALETVARLVAPMMPHLAEEMYVRLHPGHDGVVADLAWPVADAGLAAAESVTIAVQILGKLRGTIEVAPGADEATVLAAAAAEANVARQLEGKRVIKRIYVPGRIVNFVVAG
jgi:leucyl-tRNA synthetase